MDNSKPITVKDFVLSFDSRPVKIIMKNPVVKEWVNAGKTIRVAILTEDDK